MNGIIGVTGLLLDSDLDAQQGKIKETIRASGENLAFTRREPALNLKEANSGGLKRGRRSLIKAVSNSQRFHGFLAVAGVLWGSLLVAGFLFLAQEEFTPVKASLTGTLFPRNSGVRLASDKLTLVLFAHPRCPCTRASLHELDGLLAETQNRVSVSVVFTIPEGVPADLEKGDLWNSATSIPGLRVIRDQGGTEAHRFKVEGSGHVLLYAPSGKLLFSGGITASRGHEGENVGRSAIVSFVREGHSPVSHTPVFGCSLL
jgi:hypothetical protein